MPQRLRASRLAADPFPRPRVLAGRAARAPRNPSAGRPPPRRRPPPAAAPAAAPAGFGAPGVWVFTFETADNGYGSAFFHKTSGDGGTTVQLNPGVDYFLAPNVSVGANLFFSHSTGSGSNVGGGVRAGYNLAHRRQRRVLADRAVFRDSLRRLDAQHDARRSGVLAPFIWHATTHFFLGGGPDLNHELSGGSYTEYGLDFILGGWL